MVSIAASERALDDDASWRDARRLAWVDLGAAGRLQPRLAGEEGGALPSGEELIALMREQAWPDESS